MKLTSPAFQDNSPLPIDATCVGKAVSPALTIADVPDGTQSLAIVMHDPDGVHGDFTHWLVWNLPPTTTDIAEGRIDEAAVLGTNNYPNQTYGPACPPAGTGLHHYVFELYALDVALDIPAGADRQAVQAAFEGHTLAVAQLTGTMNA